MAKPFQRSGEQAFAKVDKINSELFSLTYGALVAQLVRDFEDVKEVNAQLDQMGYNIGCRLVEEFLARAGNFSCKSFRDTADVVAKVGFKMFLGVTADVVGWNEGGTVCTLVLVENPLADFVELPPSCSELAYSNIICGVLRGALEMVRFKVQCTFVKDLLRGDDANEIRLELLERLEDLAGEDYKQE